MYMHICVYIYMCTYTHVILRSIYIYIVSLSLTPSGRSDPKARPASVSCVAVRGAPAVAPW